MLVKNSFNLEEVGYEDMLWKGGKNQLGRHTHKLLSRDQGASLGNFPIFAQMGCAGDDIDRCFFSKASRASQRLNDTVRARPGYFALSLNTSVLAEMTVSNHSALYRFGFPTPAPGPEQLPYSPLMLVDLSDLSDSRTNASVRVNATGGRIMASGTFRPSFGIGFYNLHACVDFGGRGARVIRDTGVFVNNRPGSEPKSLRVYSDGVDNPPVPAGAWVRFSAPPRVDDDSDHGDRQILVRVGLSFLSADKACRNAEAEMADWNFESIRAAAEQAWRAKLAVVRVDATGVSDSLERVFWSGLYRSMLSPQDYTGENPLWKSDEPCEPACPNPASRPSGLGTPGLDGWAELIRARCQTTTRITVSGTLSAASIRS